VTEIVDYSLANEAVNTVEKVIRGDQNIRGRSYNSFFGSINCFLRRQFSSFFIVTFIVRKLRTRHVTGHGVRH
jgi:hypothetical protein